MAANQETFEWVRRQQTVHEPSVRCDEFAPLSLGERDIEGNSDRGRDRLASGRRRLPVRTFVELCGQAGDSWAAPRFLVHLKWETARES